jgi:cyclophilin family peptidyl-prolyl cis-trans isomerase
MTLRTPGFASLLLVLLGGVSLAQGVQSLEVPAPKEAPIKMDGRIDPEEWTESALFPVRRSGQLLGEGRLRRDGRQLHLAYSSEFTYLGLGMRFHIEDREAQRRTLIVVSPVSPPVPPLSILMLRPEAEPKLLDASRCDIRFDFTPKEGFTLEMRLDLDLLEVERAGKSYGFGAEIWDLEARRLLGAFPAAAKGPMVVPGVAEIAPKDGSWGADVALDAPLPPRQEALQILQDQLAEMRWASGDRSGVPPASLMLAHLGDADGKRKDAPLAALQERLDGLVKSYPDYVALRTMLVQVLKGRNDLERALEVHRALGEDYPLLTHRPAHSLGGVDLLITAGRYEEAIGLLRANEALKDVPSVAPLSRVAHSLGANWKREQEMRAADKDLPRVRLETNRGEIVLELFEDDVPNAVANFISLVEKGFYDKTRFHWVTGGRRVLGGDANSRDEDEHNDGFGDPGYLIESEPGRRLQFPYTLTYVDKRDRRRTEGCTFALEIAPAPETEGYHTVFGRVVKGEGVVRRLEYYDTLIKAEVISKRDHPYVPVTR